MYRYQVFSCALFVLLRLVGGDVELVGNPTFTTDESKLAYEEGQRHFTAGRWKDSEKCFRKCKKGVRPDGKRIVDAWLKACKGGRQLSSVEKAIEKKSWNKAWARLMKLRRTHGDTPLRKKLDELRTTVASKLFFFIATFEEKPPKPEAGANALPAGAGYNVDGKYVKEGRRSLRWEAQWDRENLNFVDLGRFDAAALQEYPILQLSIYSLDDTYGKYVLALDDGEFDQLVGNRGSLRGKCFFQYVTLNRVGWRHFRIDIRKDLTVNAKMTRDEIKGLSLVMLTSTQKKTICIDDVRLARN